MGKKKSAKIAKAECGEHINLESHLGVSHTKRISHSLKSLPRGLASFVHLKDWGQDRGPERATWVVRERYNQLPPRKDPFLM